jgi:hypothetical protein
LRAHLHAEVGPFPGLEELAAAFLACRGYSGRLARRLIEAGRGAAGEAWEMRRLAALMLQHLVLELPRRDLEELDLLCVALGLKGAPGRDLPLDAQVLAEGYSTTGIEGFGRELRHRLGSAARVCSPLCGLATAAAAWRDFLSFSRMECKLPLARYLFSPAEVAARVRGQLRLSRGVADPFPADPGYIAVEAARALSTLPAYEAEICRRLLCGTPIYWVSDATSSELNSLVESPLGTVVLVVKPPGSDLELEIKRTGRRAPHPLGALLRRAGREVPYPHRLDGGSMRQMLQWEAQMAGLVARIYRLVHGAEAPSSRALAITAVYGVPTGGREAHVLDYFTDPASFGAGFGAMREGLLEAMAAGKLLRGWRPMGLPGELGLTIEFLNHYPPAQALLAGTTSFRLDRMDLYLSPAGADEYQSEGASTGVRQGREEARRLADLVLEEALGVYSPPRVRYRSHGRYVAAALAVPANRRRADRTYLALARQLGRLWGTLTAVHGGSLGESFVARNVGLKSCWERGRRRVKIISMDHDVMTIEATSRGRGFHPLATLPALLEDERFIMGEHRASAPYPVEGAMDHLERIYRVGKDTARRGRAAVLNEMRRAYRRTQAALGTEAELAGLFEAPYLKCLRDWNLLVSRYLAARAANESDDAFKTAATRLLERRGCDPELIDEQLRAVAQYADFLTRYAFLYRKKGRTGGR